MVFGSESNLIIFFMIALIVLFVYHRQIKLLEYDKQNIDDELSKETNLKREDYQNTSNKKKKKRLKKSSHHSLDYVDDLYSDINVDDALNILTNSKKQSKYSSKKFQVEVNTEFTEMQYHKDYNDTITAINNLTPQKELFNLGFLPVK